MKQIGCNKNVKVKNCQGFLSLNKFFTLQPLIPGTQMGLIYTFGLT